MTAVVEDTGTEFCEVRAGAEGTTNTDMRIMVWESGALGSHVLVDRKDCCLAPHHRVYSSEDSLFFT